MVDYPIEPERISPTRRAVSRAIVRASARSLHWYTNHWLFLINVIMFVIAALVFVPPFLLMAGQGGLASAIYALYSPFCHQMPSRSFFIFDYQLAVCQRNLAIFVATFLAGLAFIPFRGRIKPLPWWLFALFTLPIAVDGFILVFGWCESTWALRLMTGSLFGLGTVWVAFPMIEQACQRTRLLLGMQPSKF